MTENEEKSIQALTAAIDRGYGSAGRAFWRGFLSGLGRGIGMIVGWLLLIAILYFLFKLSGLEESFRQTFDTLKQAASALNHIPWQK